MIESLHRVERYGQKSGQIYPQGPTGEFREGSKKIFVTSKGVGPFRGGGGGAGGNSKVYKAFLKNFHFFFISLVSSRTTKTCLINY